MRVLLAIHFVERTADNKLDFTRRPSKFEAKLAISEISNFNPKGQGEIREFLFVEKRAEVLEKLRSAGYYFDSFWYERPVAPARYYDSVKFPEKNCPVATKVAKRIINLPKYYPDEELKKAREIIKPYLVTELRAPKIPLEEGE